MSFPPTRLLSVDAAIEAGEVRSHRDEAGKFSYQVGSNSIHGAEVDRWRKLAAIPDADIAVRFGIPDPLFPTPPAEFGQKRLSRSTGSTFSPCFERTCRPVDLSTG